MNMTDQAMQIEDAVDAEISDGILTVRFSDGWRVAVRLPAADPIKSILEYRAAKAAA